MRTDPTGHKWDDCEGLSGYRCKIHMKQAGQAINDALKKSNTVIIFACGIGTGAKCDNEDEWNAHYGGNQPFSYYSSGLDEENFEYFGFDETLDEGRLDKYQERIVQYMSDNPDKNFILVGHSLGADAVLWAAKTAGYDRIKGVMVFDPGASINRGNNQGYIDGLTTSHVPVTSFVSRSYITNWLNGKAALPTNSQISYDAKNHYEMAVNPNVYLQSAPTLYSWILTSGQ
jgi:predicted alpha/beta hydrolase family esterase